MLITVMLTYSKDKLLKILIGDSYKEDLANIVTPSMSSSLSSSQWWWVSVTTVHKSGAFVFLKVLVKPFFIELKLKLNFLKVEYHSN